MISFDATVGINALKKVPKEHKMKLKADKVMWNPNLPARKEDINDKKIEPQHYPVTEWRDAFHLEWEPVHLE